MKIEDILKGNNVKTVVDFLQNAPVDELYSTNELTEKFGVPPSTIRHSRVLSTYSLWYNENRFYGSPSALFEFNNKIGSNEDERHSD